MSNAGWQPLLHDLVTAFAAPVTSLSDRSGQIRPAGAQGVFAADLRALSCAVVTVDGREPEPIQWSAEGHASVDFLSVLRALGDPGPDPSVWLRRVRTVSRTGLAERLTVVNAGGMPVETVLDLHVAADLASMDEVKHGVSVPVRSPALAAEAVSWAAGPISVTVHAPGAAVATGSGDTAGVRWRIVVPPRGSATVSWDLVVVDPMAAVVAAPGPPPAVLSVRADDRRISALVQRASDDLIGLRMATADRPGEVFVAAGSPWYLTLFGRDSLWAARMALPWGTELAAGTLRTLAARQGTVLDRTRAEEPGKILHEVRRSAAHHPAGRSGPGRSGAGRRFVLPPVYYGTVDATPLWICLLADAWRWGLPAAEVDALIPALERALGWLADHGDPDGDGFLEYRDATGHGLANQGWKDSGDSIRFADGRIATGPVALAEVQGYAYEAALAGAELLDTFGRSGGERWREHADRLAQRFRERFWVTDDIGSFPALALDGDKRPVDAPASNMGHLLGTGLLSPEESAAVAARLVHPSMNSGFGLRTMAEGTGGYSPLSYHCGSVWPHDTAIGVHGLVRSGFTSEATALAEGLLAAAAAFDGRLPELYGGWAAEDIGVPVPYPASCRPQAWSAAAALVVLQAFLGLHVDVPRGVVQLAPSAALGAIRVEGLAVAGHRFAAGVRADGTPVAPRSLPGLELRIGRSGGDPLDRADPRPAADRGA
jgi:glycogen debranching enzyme